MASLRTLDPRLRDLAAAFIRVLEANGIRVIVTSARRSLTEQKRLYNAYISGRSKFPAAKPGSSTHGSGLAFDLNLDGISPGKDPPYPWQYQAAGLLWEALGLRWGGRFQDPIHFDARS